MSLTIERLGVCLAGDPRRVLLRPYPGASPRQARNILSRALALAEDSVPVLLEETLRKFGSRHEGLLSFLQRRFESVRSLIPTDLELSQNRRLLIGALFSCEYSLESAALFNPSMVDHPDQLGMKPGHTRFVLSLRATGEGHVSSIVFRTGVVNQFADVQLDPPGTFLSEPLAIPNPSYERRLFSRKLYELGLLTPFAKQVVGALDDEFTLHDLQQALETERWRRRGLVTNGEEDQRTDEKIVALALSNYDVSFPEEQELSTKALFPVTPSQRNGIEDARFVLFEEEVYYATYTAYDGRLILPQLLETKDFIHFKFITLNGAAIKNKGMALFPKKINGLYAILSRQDGENIHLMWSDNIHFWHESRVIIRPKFSWELMQIGNCGSPIETSEGWLVLTHGVSLMREYSIGAVLLDRHDPSKVTGRLRRPLLVPNEEERSGYVPNVVYSCGAMVHQGFLILPYGSSDAVTRFARVELKSLLEALD